MQDDSIFNGIKTKKGYLSAEECIFYIFFHATNMRNDTSSALITVSRIQSLRSLLCFLDKYCEEVQNKI